MVTSAYDGSGGFAISSSPTAGDYPIHVTATDLNGDGSLDLVSVIAISDDLSVLLNVAGTTVPSATLAPASSTTLKVRFAPTSAGSKTAVLHIPSNDADENPYDLTLTGAGNNPPVLANAIPDQVATEDTALSFTFATNTFADVDPGNVFTYSASRVPAWLTFTPATRTFSGTPTDADGGFVDITVIAADNGTPSANVSDLFRLTVTNINDAPLFTKGPNQSHPFGTMTAQTFAGWATGIDDGDSTVTQALVFNVSNDNNSLFSGQPTLAGNGTLTYTPNGTAGSATVSVSLTDDATAGGPALTSATQTFTITVTAPTGSEISVEQPAGTPIADGGSRSFGSANIGLLRNSPIWTNFVTADAQGGPVVSNACSALVHEFTATNATLHIAQDGTHLVSLPAHDPNPILNGVTLEDLTASTPPVLTGLNRLPNGTFQFSFSNAANLSFSVLAATNVNLPASNWTVLGVATNLGGGLYQFADLQATNFPGRFYRLRFP